MILCCGCAATLREGDGWESVASAAGTYLGGPACGRSLRCLVKKESYITTKKLPSPRKKCPPSTRFNRRRTNADRETHKQNEKEYWKRMRQGWGMTTWVSGCRLTTSRRGHGTAVAYRQKCPPRRASKMSFWSNAFCPSPHLPPATKTLSGV